MTARRIQQLLIALALVLDGSDAASSAGSFLPPSPIANWDPSWAASAAHGTTIAVSYNNGDDDKKGVVLVIRNSSGKPKSNQQHKSTQTVHGIPVQSIGDDSSNNRWILCPPFGVCSMTGLVSDVEYLTRVLQKQAQMYLYTYESSVSSSIVTQNQIVQGVAVLAQELRNACRSSEGRPFGVQVLITNASHLYTLDPSGGFKAWGAATAIGHEAKKVRENVHKHITTEHDNKAIDAKLAIELALKASVQAQYDAQNDTEKDAYTVLLVYSVGRTTVAEHVDEAYIDDILDGLNKRISK